MGSRLVQIGHVLQARHAEVAARDLQAAFQHVAGDGGASQTGPIGRVPAEMGQRRSQRQRRIRHAAGDHDLRARDQRLGDLGRAQVGGRADHVQAVQRPAQPLAQQVALFGRVQRIAVHHRDTRRGQAPPRGQFRDAPRRALRVGRAEIADDGDAVALAVAQHGADQIIQQRLVAKARILVARQLRQRQGAFGQRLEDQRAAAARGQRAHHGGRAVAAVAGETGGAADMKGRAGHGGHGRAQVGGHYRQRPVIRKIERSDQFIEKSHESLPASCAPSWPWPTRSTSRGRRSAVT